MERTIKAGTQTTPLQSHFFQPNIDAMRESLIKPYCREWMVICEPLFFSDDSAELTIFSRSSKLKDHMHSLKEFCARFDVVWDGSKPAHMFSSGERIIVFLGIAMVLLGSRPPTLACKRVVFFDSFHHVSEENRARLIDEIFPRPFAEVIALTSTGVEIMRRGA